MGATEKLKRLDPRLAPAALCCFFLALYLWSHIANFFNRDPLYYALQVATGSWASLFGDRHHLLYRPAARLWLLGWQALGYKGGAMWPLQALSAAVGAATVAVFYLLCLRLTQRRRTALVGALLLGFSYGLWRYSAEAYPHVFLLFFTSLAALALARGLQRSGEAPGRGRLDLAAAGACCALGALFYQSGFLLLFSAVAVVLAQRTLLRRRRLAGALLLTVTCLILLATPYVLAMAGQGAGLSSLAHYQYGPSGWMGYGKVGLGNLAKAPIGAGNLFLGEVFAREQLSAAPRVRNYLVEHSGVPFVPGDKALPSAAELAALYALFFLAGALLIWFVGLAIAKWHKLGREFPLGRRLALAWLLPFALFPIWWFPENRQYWMGALAPLCLLLVLGAQAAGRLRWLALCAGLLATVNLFGSIVPDRQPENNPLLQRTIALQEVVNPNDLVITISAGELKHLSCYLEYYLRVRTVDLLGLFFNPEGEAAGRTVLLREMARTRREGGQIFLIAEGLGSPLACRQIAKYKQITPQEAKAALGKFLGRFESHPAVSFAGKPLLYRVEVAAGEGGLSQANANRRQPKIGIRAHCCPRTVDSAFELNNPPNCRYPASEAHPPLVRMCEKRHICLLQHSI